MGRYRLPALFALTALLLWAWQNYSAGFVPAQLASLESAPAGQLKVIFFDVGQGDAALIQTPDGRNILVDGGPDNRVLDKLGGDLSFDGRRLDTVILTHPHSDHVTGLVEVLRRYKIGEIYYTGVAHTTDEFLEWLRLIKEKNISLKIVREPQTLTFGQVKLEIVYPDSDLSLATEKQQDRGLAEGKNLNNTSIVFRLVYGQTKFLFTGDAEKEVEERLVQSKRDLTSQVLKTGHHGSHSSTGQEFLEAVSPSYAVISVGEGNDYGHPHRRTLRRLERQGVEILRTDLDGDIAFTSDGRNLVLKRPKR